MYNLPDMGETKTCGILLRKTLLGNDDALLEFFTPDEGKITLGVKAFGRSKKRQSEIDFFRLLDLGIFQGRNSKSLKSATTTKLFHGFDTSLEMNGLGFDWLEKLQRVVPEEKPTPRFFEFTKLFFAAVTPDNYKGADLYFRLKILQWLGILSDFESDSSLSPSSVKILNFLCQSDIAGVFEKLSKIPEDSISEIEEVIEEGEREVY